MKIRTIFGIDTDGNDIFIIQKANMFKILIKEPTEEEWNELAVEFNLSLNDLVKIKNSFQDWENWYKRIK